jgi:bacterioferritin-associated ferredoxin
MVACMCKGVTDGELRRAVAGGATLDEVVRATGAGSDCGCCVDTLRTLAADASSPAHVEARRRAPARASTPAAHGSAGCRPGQPPCPGCDRVAAPEPLARSAA